MLEGREDEDEVVGRVDGEESGNGGAGDISDGPAPVIEDGMWVETRSKG